MTSPIELNAASVPPPVETYERVSVVASETLKLPAQFRGSWITVQAETSDVFVIFQVASAPTATLTPTASVLTSDEPAVSALGSWRIPAGEERHYDLRQLVGDLRPDSNDTYRIFMAHISADALGRIRFYRSSGKV